MTEYVCEHCDKESENSEYFISKKNKTLCKDCGALCDNCQDLFEKDNMTSFENDVYCEDCSSELLAYCDICGNYVHQDDYLSPTTENIRTKTCMEGGCQDCCAICEACSMVVDKDDCETDKNGRNTYCTDCFHELFFSCEKCGDIEYLDTAYSTDNELLCEYCFDQNNFRCYECDKVFDKDEKNEFQSQNYCQSCYDNVFADVFKEETKDLNTFDYSSKDRILNKLKKISPITVKDLKSKHPALFNAAKEFVSFNKGRDVTLESIDNYRLSLKNDSFPLQYSTWSELQRSVENLPKEQRPKNPQLVLKILASNSMIQELKSIGGLYELFTKINDLSKASSHPYSENQIGWARLELDPNKEFILVDEIQSDHSNAIKKIKTGGQSMLEIQNKIKDTYKLNDEEFSKLLSTYLEIMKDFPNIANEAIATFAKKNGYKNLYWHEYESGKNLKNNDPPRSLYDKVPKDNFFEATEDKPFGLDGKFFKRDAHKKIIELAKKIAIKYQ